MIRPTFILAALLLTVPGRVQAAESYDSCTAYINTLPATISTAGTWCLRKDLATSQASGNAITINADNVIIDCNNFKIGGLAAGTATEAAGIRGLNRAHVTVRHCSLRGFAVGVSLGGLGSTGHVVEDNRLDAITFAAISVAASASVVQRNLVLDTGGSTSPQRIGRAFGILVEQGVDVVDNTVSGIAAEPNDEGNRSATGISAAYQTGATIGGNRVRGLVADGPSGLSTAVSILSTDVMSIRANHIVGSGLASSRGLVCDGGSALASGNYLLGVATPIAGCADKGNFLPPP